MTSKTISRLSQRSRMSPTALVALPAVVAVLLSMGAYEFLMFAIRANPAINIAILAFLAVSVVLVVKGARVLDREREVLEQGLSALRAGDRETLATLANSHMARLFGRLSKLGLADGAMLPEGSIDGELSVVRRELDQRQQPLQYLVGLMVALGLFGTFIGLLETLVSAAEVLSVVAQGQGRGVPDMMAVFSQMVASLKRPLVSMGTAFSASMFGLVGSIVIGLMVVILVRFTDRMLEQARAALYSISDSNRATLKPIASITEQFLARFLTDLTENNRRAADMLGEVLGASAQAFPAMRQVAASVQLLAERMDRQSAMLQDLPAAMARMEQIPEAIDRSNAHLLKIHASVSAQEASSASLSSRLQAESSARTSLIAELRRLLESQLGVLAEIRSGQAPAIESTQRVGASLAALGEVVSSRMAEGLGDLRSLRQTLHDALQGLSTGMRKTGDSGAELVSLLPSGFSRLEAALDKIDERLAREEETLRTQSDMLRLELDNEDRRVAGLRLLGDAVLSSAGSVDGVRQEMSGMLKGQRQISNQLSDVLKGFEITLGKMQEMMDDQKRTLRLLQAAQAASTDEGQNPAPV
jgi:hypothetical protein